MSSLWSYDISLSFNRSFRALISVSIAIYFISMFTHADMVRRVIFVYFIAMILSVFAVFAMPAYGMSMLTGYQDAWRGAFNHKNALGSQMSIAISFILYAFIEKIISRKLALLLLVGALFVLIKSNSITSLLATLITAMMMIAITMMMRAKSVQDKYIVLIFILFLALFGAVAMVYSDDILIFIGRSPTLTGRTEVWSVANALIDNAPPWGYGNAFWNVDSPLRANTWKLMGWAAPHAHSTFLDLWLQLGIIGLIFGIFLWTLTIKRTFSLMLSTNEPELILWSGLILNITIRSYVETSFVEPGTGAFFGFTLAYVGLAALQGRYLRAKFLARRAVLGQQTKPIASSGNYEP